jgi:hypothetical protein
MRARIAFLTPLIAGLAACSEGIVDPDPAPAGPYVTFPGSLTSVACPAVRPKTVLVDPTHDGGTWWFPQKADTPAGFRSDQPHQGKALADYLRAQGYSVTELGRRGTMSPDSMMSFSVIIRAGYYADAINFPGYEPHDLDVYAAYTGCDRTLVILAEFLRPGQSDALSDRLGIPLTGSVTGEITEFTPHALTEGVTTIPYIAGSFLGAESNPSIQVLGRVDGKGVMGLLTNRTAKIMFIGDVNGIEHVPQPFVQNLSGWGF